MKQSQFWIVFIMAAMLMTACSSGPNKERSANAERAIETAHKQKDYDKLIALADSLEKNGSLTQAEAYYWRGYASDRLRKYRMAEFYWKTALEECEESTKPEDLKIYAMTASRLANLLSVRGNYGGTLKMAEPVAKRLEELKCDNTSDYVNLLIYIGCCQAGIGKKANDADDGFERAYQKHKENIENNHTDPAYKNAIAGLINIAYFCNYTKDYQKAMKWIGHFGEMINEYEQRPDADTKYIDKQIARFNIYKAIALEGQGKKEEAAAAFDAFKATEFSKSPEGKIQGNDYLAAAERWDEAVDNYHSLNALLDSQEKLLTLDDIHDLLLKKYQANLQAGRRDSAARVSMQVCDSLDNALNIARESDSLTFIEARARIQSREEHAAEARQKQMGLFGALALLFLGFVLYVYYQRRADRKLKQDHEKLKNECAKLEDNASLKERNATELRLAHSLNSDTKAAEAVLQNGITAYAQLTPTNRFGSSICDYHTIDNKLFFCIGDVAGNSVESSMAAAMAKAQFRTASVLETEPQRIVEAISQSRNWKEPVTLFAGMIDMTSGLLKYYNAGHEAPVMTDKEISRLDDVSGEIQMAKGAMIYLFNKGVLTAVNKDQKQYGENKMLGAALQAMKTDPRPEPFVISIEDNLNKFIGDTEQEKDIMMLAIKC